MVDSIDFPRHKRSRRKKFQTDYQEKHREELINQLGRRFNNQPPATSNINDIPLPSESNSTMLGTLPKLTEKDYAGMNFIVDPSIISVHSAEVKQSERYVVKAEGAEHYMLSRSLSTVDNVLENFRKKILHVANSKRKLQTKIPYVEHPPHSMEGRRKLTMDNNEDDSTTSESSSFSSEDSDSGSCNWRCDVNMAQDQGKKKRTVGTIGESCRDRKKKQVKNEQKKVSRQEKLEEKERQVYLLKKGVERKRYHPNRIHPDICFNEKGLGNEGPECRCPEKIQKCGLKHGYYAGEDKVLDCKSRNSENLHYYTLRVTPTPNANQVYKTQMMINGEDFVFEGFSLITHAPLPECMTRSPICKYSMDYEFQLVEENMPDGCFDPDDCDSLFEYIFHEIFELFDFELRPRHLPENVNTCPVVHVMPRFVTIKEDLLYLWSSKCVLAYFLYVGETDLFPPDEVKRLCEIENDEFNRSNSKLKQSIILNSSHKPSALRADWFERDVERKEILYVHNSIRTQIYTSTTLPRISYLESKLSKMNGASQAEYDLIKNELDDLKQEHRAARNLKLIKSVEGYTNTGLKPDVAAHIVMSILACHHIRYNFSLSIFERVIEYQFNDRRIIELALLHSSMKSHYGTPIDHVKTLISNCGYRRKYGTEDRREKKKVPGIVSLFNIMSGDTVAEPILHNERLEYLGDAVVELIVSHHLFFMLAHHFEGGLATYRTALVQNRNLASLAKNIRIHEMLQFAHGADLINEAEWKHALANAFESVIAAVYLDGGLVACDRIFSKAMYGDQPALKEKWDHVNEHELKREDPQGDRDLSYITPTLASFHKLEERLGIQFNNIRLLAKAFTRRNIPNNDLTKGHNQRLEWLGDSVLQLIVSDYLYRNFPYHHEGHMSLLRTSLVSNQTQSVVCDDLGFTEFVLKASYKTPELKLKDKADLVEAFIGALYVDRGIEHCRSFIRIVFCPRLKHFIDSETWNDAKSHLQQWCLAMRDKNNPDPSMPEYRVLGIEGPTNSRIFKVAVYFRGKRLASAAESNVHKAELRVAELALASLGTASFSKMKDKKQSRKNRQ